MKVHFHSPNLMELWNTHMLGMQTHLALLCHLVQQPKLQGLMIFGNLFLEKT
jgi:hypothetical protein